MTIVILPSDSTRENADFDYIEFEEHALGAEFQAISSKCHASLADEDGLQAELNVRSNELNEWLNRLNELYEINELNELEICAYFSKL